MSSYQSYSNCKWGETKYRIDYVFSGPSILQRLFAAFIYLLAGLMVSGVIAAVVMALS